MSARRVYEIAKDLGLSSKAVVDAFQKMGEKVKSHSSTVTVDAVVRLKRYLIAEGIDFEGAPKPEPVAGPEPQADGAAAAAPAAEPAPAVAASATIAQTQETPAVAEPEPQPEPAPQPAAAAAPAQQPGAQPASPSGNGSKATRAPVHVHHGVTVKEFAEKAGVEATQVIRVLMRAGSMKAITQSMTDEEVIVVADELGVAVDVVEPEVEELLEEAEAEAAAPEAREAESGDPRPPVVTVMGHVDHGKTTVLDHIRSTDVAAGEHGGITQHIGAYQVTKDGQKITFLDTPGHEAFTAMRARGAKVTDIAVLVVAADDGVMPQTVEAMNHAKAAGVPIIVAVNKIDKADAQPERVRTELSQHGLQPQEWGGETMFVDISAKTGDHMDDLLTAIVLESEDLGLTAPAVGPARGVVLEAHLDKGRGAVATILVQKGTLRRGDCVVAGSAWAKVRTMLDEHGTSVKEATPARPVVTLGWNSVPHAGDDVRVVADERTARSLAQERETARRQADIIGAEQTKPRRLEDLFAGPESELRLVIKADVQGSVEALADALSRLDVGVDLKVLHKGTGGVTANDVRLAQTTGAIVVGFNVVPDVGARQLAADEGVDIRTYRVIYEAIEEIEKALKGLLAPEFREHVLGSAEVREIFRSKRIVIAGCYVTNGEIVRNAQARLIRNGAVVYEGRIGSLRRFKEDVRTVASGFECGIGLENFADIHVGDVIEVFEVRQQPAA